MKASIAHWITTATAALALCAGARAQLPGGPPQAARTGSVQSPGAGASASYRVGPGDLLSLSVYRAPDMQSVVRVDSTGAIAVPPLGNLKVANMTAGEISALVAGRLKQGGILLDPIVNVLVTEVRANVVTVMGAVARAGEMPLDRPGMTLAEILGRAGATFGTGSGIVSLADAEGGQRRQVRIADIVAGRADRPARAGEVLVVESAPTVYVSGEVGRPGAFPLEPNMTVGQAIALGGGVTPRGSSGRIRLTRKQADGTTQTLKADMQTPVRPDDLILVRPRIF